MERERESTRYYPSYLKNIDSNNKYKIVVKTVDNRIMTFHIDSYKEVGSYIEFLDKKTNELKMFPIVNTEIHPEVKE